MEQKSQDKSQDKPKLILPPKLIHVEGPIIFLGGPIQGAKNWQETAIELIHSLAPQITIASPRRDKKFKGDIVEYNNQVDWETTYLRIAAQHGAILFWLAMESEHIPGRAYAQTSRFELGEWKERHARDGTKLIVGIESGFSNEKYIKRRFHQDCPGVPIFSTLEETCQRAVKRVLEKS